MRHPQRDEEVRDSIAKTWRISQVPTLPGRSTIAYVVQIAAQLAGTIWLTVEINPGSLQSNRALPSSAADGRIWIRRGRSFGVKRSLTQLTGASAPSMCE